MIFDRLREWRKYHRRKRQYAKLVALMDEWVREYADDDPETWARLQKVIAELPISFHEYSIEERKP
jgi:hypothetical protein